MPDITCPLPTAHSYVDVKAAYDKAKKAMPTLTPAAWRKAAAQSLGMDYNTFLAIWKTKGKTPLVPGSTPTQPIAAGVAPKMPKPTAQGVSTFLTKQGFKKQGYTKVKTTHTGQVYGGGSKLIEGFKVFDNTYDGVIIVEHLGANALKHIDDMAAALKAKGYNITHEGNLIKITTKATEVAKEAVEHAAAKSMPMKKAAAKPGPKPKNAAEEMDESIDGLVKAYANGEIDMSDVDDILGDLKFEFKGGLSDEVIEKKIFLAKAVIKNTKVGAKVADDVVDAAGVIQTEFGPLTHDLVKSAYAKMKKTMPGATPAEVRKATAAYLKVDYNDFLKAWKKPTSAADKAKTTPADKLPDSKEPPLHESPAGKYDNKDITPDELKDELAKLYGPGANKNYISYQYDDMTGTYSNIQFPTSLLPTQAAQNKVASELMKLGLKVSKQGPNKYSIQSKHAIKNYKPHKPGEWTYSLPDGTKVMDLAEGQKRTDAWWRTLDADTQAAWKSYTGSGYSEINRYWRHGTGSATSVRSRSRLISNSMQVVEEQITVFRGTQLPISKFVKGTKWTDEGFMSTAVNPGSAWTGVKFEIVLPPGTRGRFIGARSSHSHENEFLVDMMTEFRILEVDAVNNRVKMVAIPKKTTGYNRGVEFGGQV